MGCNPILECHRSIVATLPLLTLGVNGPLDSCTTVKTTEISVSLPLSKAPSIEDKTPCVFSYIA